MTALDLAGLAPGFADPVRDAQRAFRAILTAMSYPGRLTPVPVALAPPAPLGVAAAAACLALVDYETPLWLDAAAAPAAAWAAFHTGAPIVAGPRGARFALAAAPGDLPDLAGFDMGEEDYPDRSATLILQVRGLAAGGPVRLSGPGIPEPLALSIEGLAPSFWADWRANNAMFPQGVDVLLAAGDRVVGLPRTIVAEA